MNLLSFFSRYFNYWVVVHSNGKLEVRTLKNFSQVDELS
jgi:hypothetical protein